MPNNDISKERVLTKDGRFNYNRSFSVESLPKVNGIPFIGDMNLPDIGVHVESVDRVKSLIADTWRPYGITL